MGKTSVVAGIVAFNPDLDRLRENVMAALAEVDEVLIVDNASENARQLEDLVDEAPRVHLLRNPINGGIARALNQAISWAADRQAPWILLLDQDSVVSQGMVDSLARNTSPDVGIVAPAIIDRSDRRPVDAGSDPTDVNYCITSGSLCNVKAWQAVGGYDESMFIDFVDFDFCLRVRQKEFRIVREPKTSLLHEIGKITRHGRFTAYHHSAFRSYHMARDMLYYAYKHRRSSRHLKVQARGLPGTYLVLVRKAIVIALYEEDRARRLWSILKGVVVGTYALRHVQSSR
jgi:rhamnosyltransferase